MSNPAVVAYCQRSEPCSSPDKSIPTPPEQFPKLLKGPGGESAGRQPSSNCLLQPAPACLSLLQPAPPPFSLLQPAPACSNPLQPAIACSILLQPAPASSSLLQPAPARQRSAHSTSCLRLAACSSSQGVCAAQRAASATLDQIRFPRATVYGPISSGAVYCHTLSNQR